MNYNVFGTMLNLYLSAGFMCLFFDNNHF